MPPAIEPALARRGNSHSYAPLAVYTATVATIFGPSCRHAFGSPHTVDYCGIGGNAATVDNCECVWQVQVQAGQQACRTWLRVAPI